MMKNTAISRRTFMKGAAATAVVTSAGGLLSACASQQEETLGQDAAQEEVQTQEEPTQEEPAEETEEAAAADGILVAYFSGTGNTQEIAEAIAGELGADIFSITPVVPYSEADLGYNNPDSRTSQERNDPNRSVELEQVTPDNFDSYGTVFLGYPIWWGNASWAIDNFVSGNDFTGKTVIPFCTSGSSPIGSSAQDLAAMAGTGEWQEGRRFGAGAVDGASAWLGELGY